MLEWKDLIWAVVGVLLAAAFEAISGGWFRLKLYRFGRRLRRGPAPNLVLSALPTSNVVDHPWAHIEVANSGLRWAVTNDAERVTVDGVLDGKHAVHLLWDALGPAVPQTNIARDEWATIPVAIQARKPVPIAENHLEAGVTYLTDLQFLRQRNPTVLAPGEHTLTINVRPNRDDPVKGTFRLVVPEVGSDVTLAIELLPSKG